MAGRVGRVNHPIHREGSSKCAVSVVNAVQVVARRPVEPPKPVQPPTPNRASMFQGSTGRALQPPSTRNLQRLSEQGFALPGGTTPLLRAPGIGRLLSQQ